MSIYLTGDKSKVEKEEEMKKIAVLLWVFFSIHVLSIKIMENYHDV